VYQTIILANLLYGNLNKNEKLPLIAAKIHWGRRLDKFYFSILQLFLTWDDDAASNSPTDFSSGVMHKPKTL
jgi:hypothetical protein